MSDHQDQLATATPGLERARIPFRDGQAYDQWDAIAAALYRQLVVEPLSWAVRGRAGALQLPPYEFELANYTGMNSLRVTTTTTSSLIEGESLAFSGFTSLTSTFDAVRLVRLDERQRSMGSMTLPWAAAKVELFEQDLGGTGAIHDQLFVPE